MVLDPRPVILRDPVIPVVLQDRLGVFPTGHIMVALARGDGVAERSFGDPPLEDEPRTEVHTSLFAVTEHAVGTQRRGGGHCLDIKGGLRGVRVV